MKCNNCGKQIPKESRFCPYCRSELNRKININKKIAFNKKLVFVAILLIVLIAFWFCFFYTSNKRIGDNVLLNNSNNITKEITELKLNNLAFDIKINENASVEITEKWNIDIKDTNTLFKSFTLDYSKYSSISNVKVYEILENGEKREFEKIENEMYHVTKGCYYSLINSNGDFEIAWGVDIKNETKIYEISYIVNDVVKVYNDCAELSWQFIGVNNQIPIDKINGQIIIINNEENLENIKVWGHFANKGNVEKNNNSVLFHLQNVKKGDYLEIRIVMPKEKFETNNIINKDMLEKILKEEKNEL